MSLLRTSGSDIFCNSIRFLKKGDNRVANRDSPTTANTVGFDLQESQEKAVYQRRRYYHGKSSVISASVSTGRCRFQKVLEIRDQRRKRVDVGCQVHLKSSGNDLGNHFFECISMKILAGIVV